MNPELEKGDSVAQAESPEESIARRVFDEEYPDGGAEVLAALVARAGQAKKYHRTDGIDQPEAQWIERAVHFRLNQIREEQRRAELLDKLDLPAYHGRIENEAKAFKWSTYQRTRLDKQDAIDKHLRGVKRALRLQLAGESPALTERCFESVEIMTKTSMMLAYPRSKERKVAEQIGFLDLTDEQQGEFIERTLARAREGLVLTKTGKSKWEPLPLAGRAAQPETPPLSAESEMDEDLEALDAS